MFSSLLFSGFCCESTASDLPDLGYRTISERHQTLSHMRCIIIVSLIFSIKSSYFHSHTTTVSITDKPLASAVDLGQNPVPLSARRKIHRPTGRLQLSQACSETVPFKHILAAQVNRRFQGQVNRRSSDVDAVFALINDPSLNALLPVAHCILVEHDLHLSVLTGLDVSHLLESPEGKWNVGERGGLRHGHIDLDGLGARNGPRVGNRERDGEVEVLRSIFERNDLRL